MTLAADMARDVEAGQAGHLDIEEQNVGRVLLNRAQRVDAVLRFGAHAQLGP